MVGKKNESFPQNRSHPFDNYAIQLHGHCSGSWGERINPTVVDTEMDVTTEVAPQKSAMSCILNRYKRDFTYPKGYRS